MNLNWFGNVNCYGEALEILEYVTTREVEPRVLDSIKNPSSHNP